MSQDVKTLCPYCGVGCGLIATTDGSASLQRPRRPEPPGQLRPLCPKGGDRRADGQRQHPAPPRDDPRRAAPTPLAVVPPAPAIAQVGRAARANPPDARPRGDRASTSPGQLTTEAQYLANKFAKGSCGRTTSTATAGSAWRSAASGMTLSLGSDGPPTCYADIELADAFLFIGSNAADCHPVTFERVHEADRQGRAKCIVVDPRRTATAEAATLHLPVRPGTDLALLNGLLHCCATGASSTERSSPTTPKAGPSSSAMLDGLPAGARRRDLRHRRGRLRRTPPGCSPTADSCITFWTMGVNQTRPGHVHEQRDHQPAPGDRPDRQARLRAVQPDRPAQRDGRARRRVHEPPAARPAARSPTPSTAARWSSSGACRPARSTRTPGYDAVRMFDALERGRDQGDLDHRHQPRRVACRTCRTSAGAGQGRAGHRAGRLLPDRNDALRRRPAARGGEPRAGRHVLQQRAARDADGAGRPAARRRAARLVVGAAGRRGDGLRKRHGVRRRGRRSSTSSPASTAGRPNDQSAPVPRAAPRAAARSSGRTRRWAGPVARRYADGVFPHAQRPGAVLGPAAIPRRRDARAASSRWS